MEQSDLVNRFTFHPATPDTGPQFDIVRAKCFELACHFNATLPEGRDKSLVMTYLENVMYSANAAIARN